MAEPIRIFSKDELNEAGPPTPGMKRKAALANDEMWMGEVRTDAGVMSGWHHHGEHTTYGYIIDGEVRVEFGPNGSESLQGASGDFFMVPPHTVHREGNPGAHEHVLVVVRVGSGPPVINVDGPEAE